jgi:AcrR family transcriptional regulator
MDAAVRLFSEHGYTGTTMRDIAKAVGLLPGSLYSHIDSKETLLFAIVEGGIEKFLAIQKLDEASKEAPDKRLRAAIKAHVDVVAEDPQRMLIVFHQWRFLSDENRARAAGLRRGYASTYTRILADGVKAKIFRKDVDTRIAVFAILGALNWTPEWYSRSGELSAEKVGDRLADLLISGLRA